MAVNSFHKLKNLTYTCILFYYKLDAYWPRWRNVTQTLFMSGRSEELMLILSITLIALLKSLQAKVTESLSNISEQRLNPPVEQ